MSLLSWVVPLLLVWPLLWGLRVLLVFRVLGGLRLGRDIIEPIAPEEISAHMREALESWRNELEASGFTFRQGWIARSQYNPELSVTQVEFVDQARVVRAIFQPVPTAARSGELYFRLCSTLADGREIVTTSYEAERILPGVSPVSSVTVAYVPLEKVYAEHLSRIRSLATLAMPLLDLEEAAARQHSQNLIDVTLQNAAATGNLEQGRDGAYRWKAFPALKKAIQILRDHRRVTREAKSVRRTQKMVTLSPDSQVDFDWDHYVQARALKRVQFNGKTKTVIAIVSLILFSLALTWGTSFEIAAAVIVALVVHEGGHLWAMRWFGHRDTQLIFIPFLGGAAVANDDLMLQPWKRIVVLLMGPLPGLIGGMALFLYAMIGSGFQWMMPSIVIMTLNLFNLLPILPLDGGQIFDVAIGSRFPKARLFFYGASAIALLAVSWFANGGTMLLVLGVFMLWRVPVERRLANLEEEVREEMTTQDEESVVRRLLARLREPLWKKTSMPQKLVVARTLQRKIRQPVPGWGTAVFAMAAYTCPIWLIIPCVLLGLSGSAARDVATANTRAAAAGLNLKHVEGGRQAIAEADNAAPLLKQVEDVWVHDRARSRISREEASEFALDAKSLTMLHDAACRHEYVSSEPESGATRRAHSQTMILLAGAADRALAEGDAARAFSLAEDGLHLTRLLQRSGDAWHWNAHAFATHQFWSILEKALAAGKPLPAKRLEALATLADDETDLRFAQQGMAEEMLSNYAEARERSARYLSHDKTFFQTFLGAVVGVSTGRAYGNMVDQAITLKHGLNNLKEGHWTLNTPGSGGTNTTVSQLSLDQLATHLAYLRLIRAGLAVQWQMATTGRVPASFQELSSPWWHGAPRHPASGDILQWKGAADVLVLSFPSKDLPLNEKEENDEVAEDSPLSWSIPLRAES